MIFAPDCLANGMTLAGLIVDEEQRDPVDVELESSFRRRLRRAESGAANLKL